MTESSRSPRYPVGTVYRALGRHPRECVVVDILTTRNLAGIVVAIRYVATHAFLGQTVTNSDVLEASIARGFVSSPA